MRGKPHSDAVRAEVIAALMAGQGVSEIARNYNLPDRTVRRIRDEVAPEQLAEVAAEKKERIADLIENHLRSSLRACEAIAKHSTDRQWLSEQTASDVAVLYGVLTDKAIRILEAAERDEAE